MDQKLNSITPSTDPSAFDWLEGKEVVTLSLVSGQAAEADVTELDSGGASR